MKFFAAIQSLKNPEKTSEYVDQHLSFLEKMIAGGHIYMRGKFSDGAGGLTIFKANSLEEARGMAEGDPYVRHGVRHLDLHEWEMKPRPE